MPVSALSLLDLISPYQLLGKTLGSWQAALGAIYVDHYKASGSAEGTTIRGVAKFAMSARPFIDIPNATIGVTATAGGTHPQDDATRRDPWIDIRDAQIEFEFFAPRIGSPIIGAAAEVPVDANNVFNVIDAPPLDIPASDYPGVQFTLDMILTTAILRPPLLKGAKLRSDGLLEPDPAHTIVSFSLPRLRMQLSQDAAGVLAFNILSVGASGLDDGGDLGSAELIKMNPPYAFIGDSRIVGFGFRSAVLDLSDGYTPPNILEQFGYDENWTGLYLPEIRIFFAPHGMNDFAFSAGASNLLIGIGNTPGLTGDFEIALINQGAAMSVSARFYGPGDQAFGITRNGATATAMLPQRTRMVVDAKGKRPPYTYRATLDGMPLTPAAGQPNVFDVDLGGDGRGSIQLIVTDGSAGEPGMLQIAAGPRPRQALPPPPTVPRAELSATSTTRDGARVEAPSMRILSQTIESVTLELDPSDPGTVWQVRKPPGAAPTAYTGPTVTVSLTASESSAIQATTPGVGGSPETVSCYFRFDQPNVVQAPEHAGTTTIDHAAGLPGTVPPLPGNASVLNPTNSSTDRANTAQPNSAFSGQPVAIAYMARINALTSGSTIPITGWASNENDPRDLDYNFLLSRRRAESFAEILRSINPAKNFIFTIIGRGPIGSSDLNTRRTNWRADAQLPAAPVSGTITTGILSREGITPAPSPPEARDPEPTTPSPPAWFRSLAAKLRIVRSEFVAVELEGEFDINTPTERFIQQNGGIASAEPTLRGLGSNPADGVIKVRIVFQIDNATGDWTALAYLGANPADRNGLAMTGQLPGEPLQPTGNFPRNLLGMTSMFAPLLDAAAPANPTSGDVVPLALAGAGVGLAAALAQRGFFNIERVIWWGGEIVVRQRANGTEVTLLADVETALSAENITFGGVRILSIPRNEPLSVRYKAIGLRFGNSPGERDFQFRPVFDSSKGYTIDLSTPGAIRVPDPLGQIVKILGARIARTNPLTFEFDLGLNIDLGVITFDRARVRLKIDPFGDPELTAFGAGVNITNVLVGKGSFEIGEQIGGGIDLQLIPINTRVRGALKIANIPADRGGPATGLYIAMDLELPVAIPLGGSGLGMYGFLGMFAMHYARDESGLAGPTIALDWLKNRAQGDPTKPEAWAPNIDHWAFGVGATVGTMGSNVIFNMKGVLLLELPGPRILLMMKARLLQPMPALKDRNAEGNLLAVIDLDAARGTLTIGIVAHYEIDPLIEIRVPVEAFFNLNEGSDWHLYLGQRSDPIQAKILSVIDASGYLMLSGNGLPAYADLPEVRGFAIGTGLHASFTWGDTSIRLYLRIGAGFDAVVGFEPFRLAGKLYIRGELVLFIISISAYAELSVDVGEEVIDDTRNRISRIDGEVCGEVDFFFFSIEGCVSFHLGRDDVPLLPAPPLVRDLKLVSRSPALVLGTGADRPVDGALGTAPGGATPPADASLIPVVPIDAIPVLMFSVPPVDSNLKVFGEAPLGHPGAQPGGWQQQGKNWVHYEIKSVKLIGAIGPGNTPSVWWTLNDPTAKNIEVQLALLSWVPSATPKAFTRSNFQEETIKERWGTVCNEAAPPTSVMWTFRYEKMGPSELGWVLEGEAWPDPPDTVRSQPVNSRLEVREGWRCGISIADRKRGIYPAIVDGVAADCPKPPKDKETEPIIVVPRRQLERALVREQVNIVRGRKRLEALPAVSGTLSSTVARLQAGQAISRAELLATELAMTEKAATTAASAIDNAGTPMAQCQAKVLASPMLDVGRVVALGDPTDAEEIERIWDIIKFRPPELFNSVVLHSGDLVAGRILMFVLTSIVHNNSLLVRQRDREGHVIDEQAVTLADVVPTKPLPIEWTDVASIWHDDVQLAAGYAAKLGVGIGSLASFSKRDYLAVLVEVKGAGKVETIEIGQNPNVPINTDEERFLFNPYYLAVVELMSAAEVGRSHWDAKTVTRNRGALEAAFSEDSSGHALLMPDTAYKVHAEWVVKQSTQDNMPTDEETAGLPETPGDATFHFRTDAQAPKSLEPWVLVTLPEDGESHVFGKEPISFVFATNDVSELYAAYGKKLQVRIKAASFRRPESTPTEPHPFPINNSTLKKLPGSIFSPWEESVGKLLETNPCVTTAGSRTRHERVQIPIPLDPYMDYLVDIEAVNADAPDNTVGDLVLRRSFSTSAYGSLGEFANTFLAVRPEHRYVEPGKIATLASTFASHVPQGSELDEAFLAAGLEPMGLPTMPRVIALWEQADSTAAPQPVAVIVDSPEPIWRSRLIPKKVVDSVSGNPERYEMKPVPWLQLHPLESTPKVVDKIISAPGGQRAVVILLPNSRGKGLDLGLKRTKFEKPPTAADYLADPSVPDDPVKITYISLLRAPWEEE